LKFILLKDNRCYRIVLKIRMKYSGKKMSPDSSGDGKTMQYALFLCIPLYKQLLHGLKDSAAQRFHPDEINTVWYRVNIHRVRNVLSLCDRNLTGDDRFSKRVNQFE